MRFADQGQINAGAKPTSKAEWICGIRRNAHKPVGEENKATDHKRPALLEIMCDNSGKEIAECNALQHAENSYAHDLSIVGDESPWLKNNCIVLPLDKWKPV